MMIAAQDKTELSNLLASVKNSIVNLYPQLESDKLLQISRNLRQIANICKI